VWALAVAPNGRWLASASTDGTVRVWHVDVERCAMPVRTGHALRHIVTDGVRVFVAGDWGPYFLGMAGS